jgi:hypothetical protein
METATDTPRPVKTPVDGDVFAFSYNQAARARARDGLGHGDLSWCFDGQLVWRRDHFVDSYWGIEAGVVDGRKMTWSEALRDGSLRFLCNLNDVESIREDQYPLYGDGDAFNLSHQHGCHKFFVKRRGAKKNKARMAEAVEAKVTSARSEVDRAVNALMYAVARRAELLPLIEAGEEPSI